MTLLTTVALRDFRSWSIRCVLTLPFALTLTQCTAPAEEATYGFPPEWEHHEAVWIDFTDEAGWINQDHEARIEVIEALHQHVPVKVLVNSDVAVGILDSMLAETGVNRDRLTLIEHPIPNPFLRDAGPIFLTDGADLRVADFRWNCYGRAASCEGADSRRGEVANDLADRYGWSVASTEIAAEGGGLESSSTVILSYRDFAESRNPGIAIEEIEAAFLDMYGKEKVIWIDESPLIEQNGHKIDNYYGQGANGHIDAAMRFVNDSTVLVAVMDESERGKSPIQKHDYEVFRAGLEQIRASTNTDGRPFHVVEIPVPDFSLYSYEFVLDENTQWGFSEHSAGESVHYVPIMSYANFLITNDVVLVAEYWREGLPESERRKDERVKEILATYFPDREVVGIRNAIQLNWNGGGIHCQTQQQPSLGR
jgi:agmatine deiminase